MFARLWHRLRRSGVVICGDGGYSTETVLATAVLAGLGLGALMLLWDPVMSLAQDVADMLGSTP